MIFINHILFGLINHILFGLHLQVNLCDSNHKN